MATTAKKTRLEKVTPETMLKFQLLSDAQIAPDGETILFVHKTISAEKQSEYETNLWTVDVATKETRQFTSGKKDSHGRWSPDGSQIAFLSSREKPKTQIYLMSASGGEATVLTDFPEGSIGSFQWSPDGTKLAVTFREQDPDWTEAAKKEREENGLSDPPRVLDDIFYRLDGDGYFNHQRYSLYLVDADTGEHTEIYNKDRLGFFDYSWSPDSKELVVSANTHKEPMLNLWRCHLYRVDVKTKRAKKIAAVPEGTKDAVIWSPDGQKIAFAGREGKEIWGVRNTLLYVHDLKSEETLCVTEKSDYCLTAATLADSAEASFSPKICWTPDSSRIMMNFGWKGARHIYSVPASGGKVIAHTKKNITHEMGNFSADGKRVSLTVGDQLTLPEIAIGEMTSPTGTIKVKPLNPLNRELLKGLTLAEPTTAEVETPSGTTVQYWTLLPPGHNPKKKYPAILQVHGGPHCQYGEGFFHEFQTLAAAGYVVVFSNPRGSKGYGEVHTTAIMGKWGAADWEDVQAVTGAMKENPNIDPKRIAIMGGSYGGYMTNWAITHSHEYKAAITDRCVSNLVSMAGSSDFPLVPGEYWEGDPWEHNEAIWDQSPMKYIKNVKTPTMVIHSEGDLRCNVEQGEQVFSALKVLGVPTRFVRYPSSTSHGLSRGGPADLRIHRLNEILRWFEAHL